MSETDLQVYHYIYRTTNLLNNKIYIGVHSTKNLNDGYIGSGKYLLQSVAKHGINNFKTEILVLFGNRNDAYYYEGVIVNDSWIKRNDNYNITNGGKKPPLHTREAYPRSVERMAKTSGANHYRFGKSPSDETRAKISATLQGRYTGEQNYMFKGLIYQVCPETFAVISSHASAKQAEIATGANATKISKCLKWERIKTSGFLWTRSPERVEAEYLKRLSKPRKARTRLAA